MTRRSSLFTLACGAALASCEHRDIYAVTRDPDPLPSDSAGSETSSPNPSTVETSGSSGGTTTDDSTQDTSEAPCAATPVAAGDTTVNLRVGSTDRSYLLHVPAAYQPTRPVPLVIDFHGAGSSAQEELQTSTYPPVTDPEGVILVFPNGESGPIGNAWNFGPCCVPGVDDFAFVDALLADVAERVCIDSKHIYAVGLLTGGGLVHHLACERANVFAAVSPSAFDLIEETVDDCAPAQPIGVVAFRGTDDNRVPYGGGSASLVPNMAVTFLGAEASFERWAQLNGCVGDPSPLDTRGCKSYSQCSNGTEVVLCTEEDGMAKPGDATIAWPILARHSR